jgi:membrane protein
MPHWLRSTPTLLKAAFDLFNRVKVPRLAAALSLYVILSLAPLLLLILSVAGLIFGEEAARGGITAQATDLIGEEGAKAVEGMLSKKNDQSAGVIATVVSAILLVVGATGVFASLQDSLNTVWEIPEQKSKGLGLWKMVRDRLLSFSAVAGMAFLLLVSLAANAALTLVSGKLRGVIPGADGSVVSALLYAVDVLLSFVLSMGLFAIVFKVLPDRRVAWKDVLGGAAFTAVLFNVGKYLIGLYLGTAAVGSSFGAAGSLVVLLVWVYYSSHLVLFGACFTRVNSEYRPPESVTREQAAAAVAAAAD